MKKIFNAFLPLTCLGMFLVSPVHAAEPVHAAAVQAAEPVHAAKHVYAAEKKPLTLSALRKDVEILQKEMGALTQGQSAINDRIRVLEKQQVNQLAKMNKQKLYSYP